MSRDVVCVADIVYPEHIEFCNTHGEPTRTTNTGILIVAKTSLTAATPYTLLSFASEDKAFPVTAPVTNGSMATSSMPTSNSG